MKPEEALRRMRWMAFGTSTANESDREALRYAIAVLERLQQLRNKVKRLSGDRR